METFNDNVNDNQPTTILGAPQNVVEPSQASEAFDKDSYIRTSSGNYVSRQAEIRGAQHVELKGRSWIQQGALFRGDLARIRLGRYCHVAQGVLLQPAPAAPSSNQMVPMVIGSHTHVGRNSQVQAAAIGSGCWIGDDVRLGPRVIVKDACIIDHGVVLGDDTVIPPFSRVTRESLPAGVFSWKITELPPATVPLLQEEAVRTYQEFVAQQNDTTGT